MRAFLRKFRIQKCWESAPAASVTAPVASIEALLASQSYTRRTGAEGTFRRSASVSHLFTAEKIAAGLASHGATCALSSHSQSALVLPASLSRLALASLPQSMLPGNARIPYTLPEWFRLSAQSSAADVRCSNSVPSQTREHLDIAANDLPLPESALPSSPRRLQHSGGISSSTCCNGRDWDSITNSIHSSTDFEDFDSEDDDGVDNNSENGTVAQRKSTLVYLNYYRLDTEEVNWLGRLISRCIIHTGIEVGYLESAFDGDGQHHISPFSEDGMIPYKKVCVGDMSKPRGALRGLSSEEMMVKYAAGNYLYLRRNCNHYAEDCVISLLGVRFPLWVNLPAKLFAKLLFRDYFDPKPDIPYSAAWKPPVCPEFSTAPAAVVATPPVSQIVSTPGPKPPLPTSSKHFQGPACSAPAEFADSAASPASADVAAAPSPSPELIPVCTTTTVNAAPAGGGPAQHAEEAATAPPCKAPRKWHRPFVIKLISERLFGPKVKKVKTA